MTGATGAGVRTATRSRTYLTLLGLSVGLLVAGLAVPFVVGEPGSTATSATGGLAPLGSLPSGTLGTGGPGGPGGAGEAGGSGGPPASADGPGDEASPPPSPGAGELTASDRGVTAEEVRVGIPVPDAGGIGSLGEDVENADADSQRAMWEAYLDEVNAAGGVHGRRVVPVFEQYNPIDPDSQLEACNALTEDGEVFAVLATVFFGPASLCVTEQHETLLLNINGYDRGVYERAGGRLFSLAFSKHRALRVQATELHRLGVLEGRTIGVLTGQAGEDDVPVREALVPTLEGLGYEVAHVSVLAADLGCYGSGSNETPVLDRMAAEGMRFTDFTMASPVCSPSRAALLTGCYPPRIGFGDLDGLPVLFPGHRLGLNPSETTIAALLSEAGYATRLVGKWHCGDQPDFLPTRHGFDGYYGIPYGNDMGRQLWPEGTPTLAETLADAGMSLPVADMPPLPLLLDDEVIEAQPDQSSLTARFVEESVRFLRANRDRPFFLYLAHIYVHLPLYVQERFARESRNGAYGVGEATNRFGEHPEVVARLRALADEARAELGDARLGVKGAGVRPVGEVEGPVTLTTFDAAHPYYLAEYDLPDRG